MKKYRLKPEALVDSGKLEYLDEMLPIFKEEVYSHLSISLILETDC
jgi:hypothetical protein